VYSPDSAVRAANRPQEFVAEPGAEPIPGYRLLEPLGSGGFGEVWKCEAPGGLLKALKLVTGHAGFLGDVGSPADRELEALQRVKAIRHPFLLSVDRIEVVSGQLVIVMELADKSLHDLLTEYQAAGQTGIPREELLDYLVEAAEALDLMNLHHGLQHLDIKPHNLFLVSNHLKVADFGLVSNLQEIKGDAPARQEGLTPLYASPEAIQGRASRQSDQYSLAIVYQELLTGVLPFQGKNANQLMIQQLTAPPNLLALSNEDQPLVARALSKDPLQRYASCLDFIQALICAADAATEDEKATSTDPRGATKLRKALSKFHKVPAFLAPRANASTPPAAADAPTELSPRRPGAAAAPPAPRPAALPCTPPPNFRALEVLHQDPLGEVHKLQGPDGRERLARYLPTLEGASAAEQARLVEDFKALRHPALLPVEVFRNGAGRIVLLTDPHPQTLADRFRECSSQGMPGLPREELIEYLYTAADALDTLYEKSGLEHLGLSPRTLLLDRGKLRIADFGLVELVGLRKDDSPTALNSRYGDPQFDDKSEDRTADQYSLALIYAELLTGVHPRPLRNRTRASGSPGSEGPKLDFLPATDREIIARALHSDPRQRFASCTELVEALEAALPQTDASSEEALPPLLPVLPAALLIGQDFAPESELPSARQILIDLLASLEQAPEQAPSRKARRNRPRPAILEHSLLITALPAPLVWLKLDGFRQEWGLQLVNQDDTSLVLHWCAHRSTWQRIRSRHEIGLAVSITLEPPVRRVAKVVRATVQIRPLGSGTGLEAEMFRDFAPGLLDSMCSYLQVAPNARVLPRRPFTEPLRIYPVLRNHELAPGLDGQGLDLSLDGVGFLLPESPGSEQVYLHLHTAGQAAEFVLLSRIVRAEPAEEGGYSIGAVFETEPAQQPVSAACQ
jgi:serine/threonine protein kinase